MEPAAPQFLDVQRLLERSLVRPRANFMPLILAAVVLVMLLVGQFAAEAVNLGSSVEMIVKLVLMFALVLGFSSLSYWTVRNFQTQQKLLQSIDELMQLRRWPEAAVTVEQLLSQPSRLPQIRVQGLVYLGGVLARYHRYQDTIDVYDHVLDHFQLDAGTDLGLRTARAMAMLQEDHLFDADRAISELRRHPAASGSAGLALVEIYRHVKTGHMQDAIDQFQLQRVAIRTQLGHRLGDAYALIARAHDVLLNSTEAQLAYTSATRLQSEDELQRRYAEVGKLAGRYQPAISPAEVA